MCRGKTAGEEMEMKASVKQSLEAEKEKTKSRL